MAALLLQTLDAANGETRTLLLVLLILAVMLILAGAIIAIITFSYARKERHSLTDEHALNNRR
jgi:flagellar basal body-associated protein FliL